MASRSPPLATQYRGLYSVDGSSGAIARLTGAGPLLIEDEMVECVFKYDTGAKEFRPLPGARGFAGSVAAIALARAFVPHFFRAPGSAGAGAAAAAAPA